MEAVTAVNVSVEARRQHRRRKNCGHMVFETMSGWILHDEASPMPPPSVYMVSKCAVEKPSSLEGESPSGLAGTPEFGTKELNGKV